MIACDMLDGAFNQDYDLAVLISGDTDYAYALEMVAKYGRGIGWVYLPSQEHVDRIKQVVPTECRLLLDEKTFRTVMLRPPFR